MAATGQRPVVLRPRRGRAAALAMALLIVGAACTVAVVLPSTGPTTSFRLADRLGVAAVGLLLGAGLLRLSVVRAVLRPEGLEVVNVLRRTRLEWPQVVSLRYTADDPWVVLDLSDGQTLAVMAVQKADGARGEAQARALARAVVEGSRTAHDG